MNRQSKVLFTIFVLAIIAAAGLSFFRYIVLRDYYVQIKTLCNPGWEKCFVSEDENQVKSYYKLIMKKASLIPNCDPRDVQCQQQLTCVGDNLCQEIYCDNNNLKKDEVCVGTGRNY